MREKTRRLSGMSRVREGLLPGWEAEWALYGPIPNSSAGAAWPGAVGFAPLALDGATAAPKTVKIGETNYRPLQVRSQGGVLDFCRVWTRPEGFPIAYAITQVTSQRPTVLPVAFGADWGTEWWVNGKAVYDTKRGNLGEPEGRGEFFSLPLQAGRNVIVVKVVSGMASWSLHLALAPTVRPRRVQKRTEQGFSGPRKPTSDNAQRLAELGLSGPRGAVRDYVQAGLRIEERPGPVAPQISARRERVMAEHGVQAHWIGIVDPTGTPYGPSAFLPSDFADSAENAARLRKQIDATHRNGMAAMTWFPGTHCRSAAEAHPDWRVVELDRGGTGNSESLHNLCIHSPFREALTGFVLESLTKYDLDGFWFDGAILSHPGVVGCACHHCRTRFQRDEGLAFPAHADWDDPAFRRWVAWRYRVFMEFWGELAARVRREFPRARIVVNHLHRLWSPWHSAIPIDLYAADVIAGSEATRFDAAFCARKQRAYGKADTDVWVGLHDYFYRNATWPAACDMDNLYRHHALSCLTAGAMPSFGTPDPAEKLTPAYDHLSALINPRRNFVTGVAVPFAALLLSQQAETFYFSRRDAAKPEQWRYPACYPRDYWDTVLGWHHALVENQFPLDIVFDAHLTPDRLPAYRVVVAPCAVALSDRQIQAMVDYVAGGGVLVTDAWCGAGDEWGERVAATRLRPLLGSQAKPPPGPMECLLNRDERVVVRPHGAGFVVVLRGNAGLTFLKDRSPTLAQELGALIRDYAPAPIEIEGPRRLHLGLFRDQDRLILHMHNFIAYSASDTAPSPFLVPPEPVRNVRVTLRGYNIRSARLALQPEARPLRLTRVATGVQFVIPRIDWGEVIVLEF